MKKATKLFQIVVDRNRSSEIWSDIESYQIENGLIYAIRVNGKELVIAPGHNSIFIIEQ